MTHKELLNNKTLSSLKKNDDVLFIYQHGSSIYNVRNSNSDIDFIVIVSNNYKIPKNNELVDDICQFVFYDINDWYDRIKLNHIDCYECLSLDKKFIFKEFTKLTILLNKIELRKSISSICDNSYVKAKKKFLQKDYYLGKKSLWHSLRIGLFGIQISNNNKIIDYQEANKYYKDIVLNDNNDWSYYEDKYKELFNKIRSDFRKTTELAWIKYKENEKLLKK